MYDMSNNPGLRRYNDERPLRAVVKYNCVCLVSTEPKAGYDEIEVPNPQTGDTVKKWIYPFENLHGYCTKLEWYDTEKKYQVRYWGYRLHLDVYGQPVTLDLGNNGKTVSEAYERFTQLAENIDWSKPVAFAAWWDAREKATAFVVRQDGKVIKRRYTKENPGECPPPIHDEDGWDWRARRRWLRERIEKVVVPAVAAAHAEREIGRESERAKANTGALTSPSGTNDARRLAHNLQKPAPSSSTPTHSQYYDSEPDWEREDDLGF